MASKSYFHRFNLTLHVQSKHASSQGQAKVAIMVAHDVLTSQGNINKDDLLFLFRGASCWAAKNGLLKNHAIPLMASRLSRHYKLGSGCHPFGIVMKLA